MPYLALAGAFTAWYVYLRNPGIAESIRQRVQWLYSLLINKYYFDDFNQKVLARGSVGIGNVFWRFGDVMLIDGGLVNGSARLVGWASQVTRQLQSGYLYHYAFAMIIGLAVLLACGGIANAGETMIRAWFPDAYDTLPDGRHPLVGSAPGSRGDGVLMAAAGCGRTHSNVD